MNRLCCCLLIGLLALDLGAQNPPRAIAVHQAPVGKAEARVALVIGNGAYKDAPLKNPVNDARAIAQTLRGCGFQVIATENASLQKMREGLREFGGRIARGGVGLFYFAGHGMQVKGHNYLVPVGADITSEDEVAFNSMDVDAVLAKLETARNRLNIVILDACRNDPFARSFRSATKGLAQLDAPKGTFIAFATAPGRTAADGGQGHGLYTEKLLEAMQTPGLTLENTFKRVLSGVSRASGDQQIPWTSSSVEGEFFFKPGGAPPAQGAPGPGPAAAMVQPGLQAPPPAYLEGESARKALVKDAFETEGEFTDRLIALPLVRVGTVRLLKGGNSLQKQRLPVIIKVEDWAAGQVKQRMASLELDQEAAGTLMERSIDLPLLARFEARRGGAVLVGTKVLAGSQLYSLAAALRPTSPGESWQDLDAGTEFAMVPAGSFQMGTLAADIEWLKYARPVHTVTLSRPFLLQRTPVTVAQFRSFVEATGYRTEAERGDGSFVDTGKWEKKPDGNWRNPYFGQADDCPVVCVSWNDAQAYIRWLNSKLSAVTYRLPTEAEWEYACRAGSVGETYGPLDAVAWYNGNSGGRTHPVGQKQPNAWGLFDTLGNAEQWCQDLWRDYTVDAQTDPRGSSTGSSRVFRGGSWGLGPGWCWAGFRSWLSPDESSAHLGFRLVRALP